MRFRYLIWDFDGTLFNTYPPLIRSISRALVAYDRHEPVETLAYLLSDTLDGTLDVLAERHCLDRGEFEARVFYYQRQVSEQDQPPFLGVISVCERLVKAGGRNFIFTHRPNEDVNNLLNWYKVEGLFSDCLTVEDGYPRKPDPAGFLALIEKHDLPRDAVLAVGDRTLDIVAGQRAGVRTCLFRGRPDPAHVPDYAITSFAELKQILQLGVAIG